MNISSELLRVLLSRGEYLSDFAEAELSEVLRVIEKANAEILGKIATTKGEWTREWLIAMKADLDEIYSGARKRIGKLLDVDLKKFSAAEAEWLAVECENIAVGVSFTAPAPAGLWAAITALPVADGSTLSQFLDALELSGSKKFTEAIQAGMTEGETVQQMTRRIRGEVVKRASWKTIAGKRRYVPGVYRDGVFETTTREAEALVRTAVMHVANRAHDAFYAANEDLIKGYQRVETLDGDTCLICGADDGHVYGVDEERPQLPQHPRCRGVYVPVLKSWREMGYDRDELPASTRASADGQVPENETFEDRLKKMPPKKQDAILGPTRGRLYREGMSLKDMVAEGKVVPLTKLGTKKRSAA